MKRNKTIIKNLFLGLALFLGTVLSAQDTALKVMTYNLRFGEMASLEEMAVYIKDRNPDIVALQECDWKTNRERALHQNGKAFVNELAYHTGMFGLYGKAIDYRDGYYGVGILSKYPIVKSERIFLPNPEPKTEQRILLIAEIELPNKSNITFISTHLEVSSVKVRKEQIAFINSKIKEINTAVILAGDLNATPDSKEIKKGFDTWFNATDTAYTFASYKPEIKIDYILGYPHEHFSLIQTAVDTTCTLSDHFPVSSIIQIKR
ncbi:MAG: endonuclease/exonuclease/phosphatase family protein [Pigmentiphaga sp.]|nr:endonuclease/exonuclease/phosphatase family protein [Pigmentiphaga sp.]